jgi:hypothetical protein
MLTSASNECARIRNRLHETRKEYGDLERGRARGCCKLLVMRASSVLTRLMGGWCTTLISDQFLLDFLLGVFGAWRGGLREGREERGGGGGDRRLSVLSGFAWDIYSSTTPLPGAILTSAPHSNHYSVCITTSVAAHGLPSAYLSGYTAVCFLGIFVRS